MFEWLLLAPVVTLIVGTTPITGNMSDKKKIIQIFKTVGVGVPNPTTGKPNYVKTKKVFPIYNGRNRVGTQYTFKPPLGLPSNKLEAIEKKDGVLKDGLEKPVEVEYKGGFIKVNVYDKPIPDKLLYKDCVEHKLGWSVPIGMHYKGMCYHDFSKNPHLIIGGLTGYGKTVVMKSIMTYLIKSNPEDVKMYMIDLKGGLEFSRFRNLKQVEGVSGTADKALEMLVSVMDVLYDRFELFKENGWSNIKDTRLKERIFVFIDEAAQIIPENKGDKVKVRCQKILEAIAALGRAVGIHLIFATQYPTSDALPKFIKQNTDSRIGFRLADGYASEVVLDKGNYHLAKLPYKHEGRCIYKSDDFFELQVPYLTDKEMWDMLKVYDRGERREVNNDEYSEEKAKGNEYFIND
jgi:S-DNA-T family DNA segregation ATPase FtsK/SpoIIIE